MSDPVSSRIMNTFTEDQRSALSSLRTALQPGTFIWTNFRDARYTSPHENFFVVFYEPHGKGFSILTNSVDADYLDVQRDSPLALLKLRSLDLEKGKLEEDLVEYLRVRLQDADDEEDGNAGIDASFRISVYMGRRYDYVLVNAGKEDDFLRELIDLRRASEEEPEREVRPRGDELFPQWKLTVQASDEDPEASDAPDTDEEMSNKDQGATNSQAEDAANDWVDANVAEGVSDPEAQEERS